MRKVRRDELLDYQSYDELREEIRRGIMSVKKARRVALGENLIFLFENTDTIRYQIQEMMRAEQIVKESAIRFELDTYNGLLGEAGELACVILITIEDPAERREKLQRWLSIPDYIYLKLEDGSKVYARHDEQQVGDDRLSAVQYLKFDLEGRCPVAVGVEFDALQDEVALSPAQRAALGQDLSEP